MVEGRVRTAKKVPNACSRCRRQKIKCSGSHPCDGCNKRKLACVFDDRDQKVMVTKGYIMELQEQIARMKQHKASDNVEQQLAQPRSHGSEPGPGQSTDNSDSPLPDALEPGMTNPMSSDPPAFMAGPNGRMWYLGTSSNWSFTRRVLGLTYERIYQEPLPTEALLFEGTTYDLGWDGLRMDSSSELPVIPALDHTTYMINAVRFRCGQLYHIFDEDDFMSRLHEYYENPALTAANYLWYIHFLAILALGKGFVQQKRYGKTPPGAQLFTRALKLLPDVTALSREPIISTEILCCLSLYLHSLDFRTCAHNYIGQAMRIAMAHGMHTFMPVERLGDHMVQRCRKIWWTIYVLDREMTSLMGLPQTINDDDVHAPLPILPNGRERTAISRMHIKLCRIMAEINRTVYSVGGRLSRTFLLSTKAALASIARLADELRDYHPIHLDRATGGVSRVSAYLHLLYHQCIILATRPLLFCFLKIRFGSRELCLRSLNASRSVLSLIQMCMESAQKVVNILHSLQSQDLLETFLSFDLESIFVSTVTLLMGPAIDQRLLEDRQAWLDKAYAIFGEMALSGNLVADFRCSELQRLDEMLSNISEDYRRISDPSHFLQVPPLESAPASTLQSTNTSALRNLGPGMDDEFSFVGCMTGAQVMELAESIEFGDTEWMSSAMIEHSIW